MTRAPTAERLLFFRSDERRAAVDMSLSGFLIVPTAATPSSAEERAEYAGAPCFPVAERKHADAGNLFRLDLRAAAGRSVSSRL